VSSGLPHFDCTFLPHPQERNSGDYLHRILWPARALGEHLPVTVIQSTHPKYIEMISRTEVLIVNMVANANLLALINARTRLGLVTVYEISDDFEAFPENLPSHAFYANPNTRKLIRNLASAASAIQFSSSYLQKKYRHLNKQHTVFINQCSEIPPLPPMRKGRVCVGWAGSVGHHDDAIRLADTLAHWDNLKKVRLVIMAAGSLVSIFKERGLDIIIHPPGGMQDYLDFLREIDVGIAMIGADDFSRGRSDGKFIEYVSCGVIAVCSRLGTYAETIRHGETGFLYEYDRPETLLSTLDQVISDFKLRKRVRQQAHDYLLAERTHAHAAKNRLEFYSTLLHARSDTWIKRSAAVPREKGCNEMMHPIEEDLLKAMFLHRQGQLDRAMKIYMSLLEWVPGFYLIWELLHDIFTPLGMPGQAEFCSQKAHELFVLPDVTNCKGAAID